jgi:hypothetical protein
LLADEKWKFVLILNEAMVGLHNCNGKRKICYVQQGEEMIEDWFVDRDNFHHSFMVVGAISGRGTLPLIRVPKKVKVYAEYYIRKVLRLLLKRELPKLYGPHELKKGTVHHDQASHTPRKEDHPVCARFEEEVGHHNHANPRHTGEVTRCSPLDFFGFGYLKRRLFQRKPNT